MLQKTHPPALPKKMESDKMEAWFLDIHSSLPCTAPTGTAPLEFLVLPSNMERRCPMTNTKALAAYSKPNRSASFLTRKNPWDAKGKDETHFPKHGETLHLAYNHSNKNGHQIICDCKQIFRDILTTNIYSK